MSKKLNHIKWNVAGWMLMAGLGLAVSGPSLAHADDEPFQIEKGSWMSFDHYKDAEQRGHITQPVLPVEPAADTAPSLADQTDAAKPARQAVAAPTRPIDLPILPGLNKGFAVRVDSTEDGNRAELILPAPSATGEAAPSDLRLSNKEWQSPSRMNASTNVDENGEPVDLPISVRASYLPDKTVAPIPSPDRASAQMAGHEVMKRMIQQRLAKQQLANEKDKPNARTPAQTAAEAAMSAYKKQQLDAIQSDRDTLKALQDAVHTLGLEKQLDFMSGAKGNVNAQDTTQAPPQTTVR